MFSQQLKLREIEVATDLTAGLPLIQADAGRLEQVFINLLLNGRDAIEEKCFAEGRPKVPGCEKRITVKSALTGLDTANPLVSVAIEDTGVGIKKGVIEKIFEPFFTTKRVGKGTGLGLSISYGIIKDCGGDILAESTEGKGTRFTLVFPVPAGSLPAETGGQA